MALTRQYRETVVARIRSDPEFTAALYAEAVSALVEGDKSSALSILRDLVHAHISFKTLAEQTRIAEKSLHRMLGATGNPRADNLARLIHTIEEDLQLNTRVEARWTKPRRRTAKQAEAVVA